MEAIARTRMNLLLLAHRIAVASRGLDLLRSKREALVREFFAVMDRMVEGRERVEATLERARTTLALALDLEGAGPVRSAGYAARRSFPLVLTERNVWGVRLVEVQYPPALRTPETRGYAGTGVSSYVDEAARDFELVLDVILRSVAVEVRLKRLGAEIKRVTRRINALHETVIPALARQLGEIRQVLDEREREERFRTKRFMRRRDASAPRGEPAAALDTDALAGRPPWTSS